MRAGTGTGAGTGAGTTADSDGSRSSKEEIDEADFLAVWTVRLGLEVVATGAGASALAVAFFVALATGRMSTSEED